MISNRKRMRGGRLAGFTLVEMIVATFLLAIGISAVLGCIAAATHSTAVATEYTTAAMLAHQRFAELEQQPAMVTAGDTSGSFTDDFSNFSWQQTIETTDVTSLMKVTVVIQWQSGSTPRTAQFVTYEQVGTDSSGNPTINGVGSGTGTTTGTGTGGQ
jgi:prepilin-type N-terminal cleavage/methylation domain-containing protein